MKTIIYNNLELTVDGMDVYYKGKLIKPSYHKTLKRWYLTIYLGKLGDGKYNYYTVPRYRIIAAANDPNYDYDTYKDLQVDHIDNCSSNDHPSNLRFTTRKFNNSRKHARTMKTINNKKTPHQGEIVRAEKDGIEMLFKNGMDAARGLGCSHVLIYRCLNPKDYARKAKGWTLSYVPLTYGSLDYNA